MYISTNVIFDIIQCSINKYCIFHYNKLLFLIFVIRNGFIYEVQTGLTIVTESPAARRGFSCLSKLNQLNGQEDIYVIGKKYALNDMSNSLILLILKALKMLCDFTKFWLQQKKNKRLIIVLFFLPSIQVVTLRPILLKNMMSKINNL